MANVDYTSELKRDPGMYDKVNAICEKYFQQSIKQKNGMQAMLSNLMSGGGAGGANPLASLNALMWRAHWPLFDFWVSFVTPWKINYRY